ncbi:hypothetical protein RE628_25220 [Paenibacillus sp. D2_2]|uniref:hypothetical protein n=1 Tax=Paenibacillus sp. D2_2 TaxID=3073092 RepID=UPI002815E4EA|nr:hypothetical protein [Paenibacillus sp. D2_2]WMT40455.1 hypothetical protein RE628_25220 [Paenibacillus sp. D2_2]
MGQGIFRKLIGIVLIFVLSVGIYAFFYSQTTPSRDTPWAKHGILDLSAWDFRNNGVVNLDGQWEFYEGELLAPSDFQQGTRSEVSYFNVPGTWKGKHENGGMNRTGFGTYRLKVKVGEGNEIFGMKIRSVRMSHTLYVNGQVEGSSGSPTTVEEAHLPGNTPYIALFHVSNGEVEIIIQVANYEFVTGGIVNSIQFGLHSDIARVEGIQIGTDIAAVLVLAMFGAYHLSFYFLRGRERTYLYSGIYLFSLMVGQLLFGRK